MLIWSDARGEESSGASPPVGPEPICDVGLDNGTRDLAEAAAILRIGSEFAGLTVERRSVGLESEHRDPKVQLPLKPTMNRC